MNQAFFSPGDTCLDAIIRSLNNSTSSIKICVFTISDDRITKAILKQQWKNIPIQIITDNDKCNDLGSDINQLFESGIDVKVDRTPYHMHHKYALIDDKVVLTGSYNWTKSAALYNHENLILTSNKDIVEKFVIEFNKLWVEMEDY